MGYSPPLTTDVTTPQGSSVATVVGTANVESIIRANTLDQMGAPAANVSMNTHRLTNASPAITATDYPDVGQLAGLQYAYVVSGCVWTADSSGSTLNGSMTSGTVMIKGILLTVASVTAHAFTASRDTYVDLTDNGDGTALLTYSAVNNNAMSPALTGTNNLDTCRIAIIVSTGSALTTGASTINQGANFFGPATAAATTTVAAGSNTQSITALTSNQMAVAANSLAPAGLAAVVTSTNVAGFEAVFAYTGGGGTTTLTGITAANVLSGGGTLTTGNAVTQIANWTVCDGLGNPIFPTRPRPGMIAYGTKNIGALTTTSTASPGPQIRDFTRRFIIPPGPSLNAKIIGHVVYIQTSATAGTSLQAIIKVAAAATPGTLTSVAISSTQVAVTSDGVPMHPEGITLLAPGTYIMSMVAQQGAAGTITFDGTFFASSAWVELV